jgi:nitroreductase
MVEAPEVLRRFERLFEGRLSEAEGAVEPLQLALVDVGPAALHDRRMLASSHSDREKMMGASTSAIELIRSVRQIRQYSPDPVPDEVVHELLRVARWTGSSKNTQPWHFIVVTDRGQLRKLSQLRPPINWLAGAPIGIAIDLDGARPTAESYDEGRVTERILIAAHSLGYGGGVAWYGEEAQETEAKRILGIPQERTARSMVMIGRATSTKDPRPTPRRGGRKPLSELVSYDRWGRPRS